MGKAGIVPSSRFFQMGRKKSPQKCLKEQEAKEVRPISRT